MTLRVRWLNEGDLKRFDNALKALGEKKMRRVANRAINRAGDMARTQVFKVLTKQTGLQRKVISKAVRTTRSNWGSLEYVMTTSGGDVALKYFKARETRKGVSAAPFGKRQIYAGTFIKGGRFPNRVGLNWGSHVFKRVGSSRMPVALQRSGVIIPAEMVKGATADTFRSTAARVLSTRLSHEIKRATGGVIS